jgi:hypothetical protein
MREELEAILYCDTCWQEEIRLSQAEGNMGIEE